MFKKLLSSKKVKLTLFLSLVVGFTTLAGEAFADSTTNAVEAVLCNAMNILTGGAGKTFAAFAVIGVGIMFFSGKVTWGLLVGVAVGIGAIFGAPTIVAAIAGSTAETCAAYTIGSTVTTSSGS